MTYAAVVSEEEMERILDILGNPSRTPPCGGGVVLITEKLAKKHGIEEGIVDYAFGGEADVLLDIVTSEKHYFLKQLNEDE